MESPSGPEAHADYRLFRFLTVTMSRGAMYGVLFIVWALVWGFLNQPPALRDVLIFLLMTTALLTLLSLGTGMTAYWLFKKHGGVVEKGPRTAAELLAGRSGGPEPEPGRQHVAADEHQARDEPRVADDARPK